MNKAYHIQLLALGLALPFPAARAMQSSLAHHCTKALVQQWSSKNFLEKVARDGFSAIPAIPEPARTEIVKKLLQRVTVKPIHLYTLPLYGTFSPCGKYVVIKEKNGLSLWDVTTGKKSGFLSVNDPCSYEFSPKGTYIIVRTLKRVVYVFNVKKQDLLYTLKLDGFRLHISPDESKLITDGDQYLELYDLQTGTVKYQFSRYRNADFLCFRPDSQQAVLSSQGTSIIVNIETDNEMGKEIKVLPGDIAAFSLESSFLALAQQQNGAITIYDAQSFKVLATLRHATAMTTPKMTFSDDSTRLLVTSCEYQTLFERRTNQLIYDQKISVRALKSIVHFDTPSALIIIESPEKKINNVACLYDFSENKRTVIHDRISNRSMHFSPHGRYALMEEYDNRAHLVALDKKRIVHTFKHVDRRDFIGIHAQWSVDEKKLMVFPDKYTCQVWSLDLIDSIDIPLPWALALLILENFYESNKDLCTKALQILHNAHNELLRDYAYTYYPFCITAAQTDQTSHTIEPCSNPSFTPTVYQITVTADILARSNGPLTTPIVLERVEAPSPDASLGFHTKPFIRPPDSLFNDTSLQISGSSSKHFVKNSVVLAYSKLYKNGLLEGLKHPFQLHSAIHLGFVYTHFDFCHIGPPERQALLDFVEWVGPSPNENDLERIGSFSSEALCTGARYMNWQSMYVSEIGETYIDQMIDYVCIMSQLPFEKVAPHFKIKNYSHLPLNSRKHNNFLVDHFSHAFAERSQRDAIMRFVELVGQHPTLSQLPNLAAFYDSALDHIKEPLVERIESTHIVSMISYICQMSAMPHRLVKSYFKANGRE